MLIGLLRTAGRNEALCGLPDQTRHRVPPPCAIPQIGIVLHSIHGRIPSSRVSPRTMPHPTRLASEAWTTSFQGVSHSDSRRYLKARISYPRGGRVVSTICTKGYAASLTVAHDHKMSKKAHHYRPVTPTGPQWLVGISKSASGRHVFA